MPCLLSSPACPKVKRTRSRPLARGAVTPTQAVALLGGTLSLGLLILLQLNDYTKLLGASSLLLVGTYPLMKRITNWPQVGNGVGGEGRAHCSWCCGLTHGKQPRWPPLALLAASHLLQLLATTATSAIPRLTFTLGYFPDTCRPFWVSPSTGAP